MIVPPWEDLKGLYSIIGFEPLPKQEAILSSPYRNNILVGGVGSGKSLTAGMYAMPRVTLRSVLPRVPLAHYWFVGENYNLPREEFDYTLQALGDLGIPIAGLSQPSDGRWAVEIGGVALLETKSWTNPESLHAVPVQGMLVVEAGLLPFWIWHQRLRPRLARVPGSWCMWSGTLEESGTYYKECVRDVVVEKSSREWFGVSMATWENTHVYPKGMEDPEIQDLQKNTPPDIFQERYAAIPKAVAALVYREFSHKWHVYVKPNWWDKHRPVYLTVDPAGVYAGNALQVRGDHIDVIDELHGVHWTTEDTIREAVSRPWWGNVDHVVIDAHTYKEASLIWQGGGIWETLGEEPKPVHSQHVPVSAGIELVRSKLHSGTYDPQETESEEVWSFQEKPGVAKLHVAAHCSHTIYEFSEGYKRKKLGSGQYSPDEVVKRENHHCDAIAYGLVDLFGFLPKAKPSKVYVPWVDSRPAAMW